MLLPMGYILCVLIHPHCQNLENSEGQEETNYIIPGIITGNILAYILPFLAGVVVVRTLSRSSTLNKFSAYSTVSSTTGTTLYTWPLAFTLLAELKLYARWLATPQEINSHLTLLLKLWFHKVFVIVCNNITYSQSNLKTAFFLLLGKSLCLQRISFSWLLWKAFNIWYLSLPKSKPDFTISWCSPCLFWYPLLVFTNIWFFSHSNSQHLCNWRNSWG